MCIKCIFNLTIFSTYEGRTGLRIIHIYKKRQQAASQNWLWFASLWFREETRHYIVRIVFSHSSFYLRRSEGSERWSDLPQDTQQSQRIQASLGFPGSLQHGAEGVEERWRGQKTVTVPRDTPAPHPSLLLPDNNQGLPVLCARFLVQLVFNGGRSLDLPST